MVDTKQVHPGSMKQPSTYVFPEINFYTTVSDVYVVDTKQVHPGYT